MRSGVSTSKAPAALGPHSHAIATDGLVFCSGEVGIDPVAKQLAEGIEAQTAKALRNQEAVLGALISIEAIATPSAQ